MEHGHSHHGHDHGHGHGHSHGETAAAPATPAPEPPTLTEALQHAHEHSTEKPSTLNQRFYAAQRLFTLIEVLDDDGAIDILFRDAYVLERCCLMSLVLIVGNKQGQQRPPASGRRSEGACRGITRLLPLTVMTLPWY